MFCPVADAEIYQWTDANGQTHFSDTAPKDRADLKPKELIIPTAMPATKIAKKPEIKTGPTVIEINSSNTRTGCSTASSSIENPTGRYENALETSNWKNCHGMR
jgi:hypothetical protein